MGEQKGSMVELSPFGYWLVLEKVFNETIADHSTDGDSSTV